MNKRLKIAALSLSFVFFAAEAATLNDSVQVRNVFADMPDTIMELVSRNARLDCLDFYDSQMKSTVRNRMNGLISITNLSNSFLQFQCDNTECVELKLLQSKRKSEYFICVVTTLKGESDYSTVKFFNKGWEEMPVQNFVQMPPLETFVNRRYTKKDSIVMLEKILPFMSYGIELDMFTDVMRVSLTSPSQLSLEDSAYFSKWFAEDKAVELKWNGNCFKRF